jgi:hypothetical protein
MEQQKIILSKVSQAQKTKNQMFSPYAVFRFRENKESNVVGLGSHDKGRAHMGGVGIGRRSKT